MAWPVSVDYSEAIQNPRLTLLPHELKAVDVEYRGGVPMGRTGSFAVVYRVRLPDGSRWAIRCFTRSAGNPQARYAAITRALERAQLPCFLRTDYIERGILVHGSTYPIVRMEWAEGVPLADYVSSNANDARALLELASSLHAVIANLERLGMSHGDISSDNVLIDNGRIRLIDYDGMFLSAFAGQPAPEAGTENFRHPRRSASSYGIGMDRFPALVVITSLAALAADQQLLVSFGSTDRLLFTEADLRNPRQSQVFAALTAHQVPEVRVLAIELAEWCEAPPERFATLPRPPQGLTATVSRPRTRPGTGPLSSRKGHSRLGRSQDATSALGEGIQWVSPPDLALQPQGGTPVTSAQAGGVPKPTAIHPVRIFVAIAASVVVTFSIWPDSAAQRQDPLPQQPTGPAPSLTGSGTSPSPVPSPAILEPLPATGNVLYSGTRLPAQYARIVVLLPGVSVQDWIASGKGLDASELVAATATADARGHFRLHAVFRPAEEYVVLALGDNEAPIVAQTNVIVAPNNNVSILIPTLLLPPQLTDLLSTLRNDLDSASLLKDRGEYVRASHLVRDALQLVANVASQYPSESSLATVQAEGLDLREGITRACETERMVAAERGVAGPMCR
jgi:hypothetical protein